jgi:hypothetical protein
VAVAKWKYALFLCRVFQTVFAGDVATALLNTLLHDRDVAVAPDEHRWDGYLVVNSPCFSCGSA